MKKAGFSLSILVLPLLVIGLTACSQKKNFGLPSKAVEAVQEIKYNNKVDILFVMDNSSSMEQHQQNISGQVEPLIDALLAKELDFHIGVTTTDVGSGGGAGVLVGSPAYLTSKTVNLKQEMRTRLLQGDEGSPLERGLEAVQKSFSAANLAGANNGFFRDESFLIVVVVSDEEDFSAGTVESHISFLNSVKPPDSDGAKNWIFNFIGVLELTGDCRTMNSFASPGLRYMDIAKYSGGIEETICTADFKNTISNIRQKIISRLTDYPLQEGKPNVASIRVLVNGVLVAQDPVNGWSYLPEKNLVRFNGTSIPPENAKVSISYDPTEAS